VQRSPAETKNPIPEGYTLTTATTRRTSRLHLMVARREGQGQRRGLRAVACLKFHLQVSRVCCVSCVACLPLKQLTLQNARQLHRISCGQRLLVW
jgi:hypothetical protein